MAATATKSRDLVCLSRACKAIAEAKDVDEVKMIRDQGQAAIKWAKSRRDVSFEAIADGAEIVLRAERMLGKMLKETIPHNGGRPKQSDDTTVLADHGISRDQSHRWQLEAKVAEEQFQQFILEAREAGKAWSGSLLVASFRELPRPFYGVNERPAKVYWPRKSFTDLDSLTAEELFAIAAGKLKKSYKYELGQIFNPLKQRNLLDP